MVAGICVTSLENNIKSCELMLVEAHYLIYLVLQPCGSIKANFSTFV